MTLRVGAFAGAASEWDDFVRSQPGWTHFHLVGWRSVVQRVFGHECIYLAARDDRDALAGVLPLVRVRSVAFGHYLVSMPFVNYGGPLGSDGAVVALAEAAAALARSGSVKLLELRSRRELPLSMRVSHRKVTVLRDIPPGGPDAFFRSFDAKLRSQIRRPQKEGVIVRFGVDQVTPFFDVFSRHMRDLGTPTQPRRLFETIVDEFPDAWVGCAYLNEQPIACGFAFSWGGELEMTWASALNEFRKLSPNMLLYWAFMERASREGLRVFNFGRCTPGSGTHRFKQQWGTRDEQLWWYQLARDPEAAGTPSPDDGAYSWGPRLWKRLPTPVATALGPRIVRYIP